MFSHCALTSSLSAPAGRFSYTPLALRSAWTGREPPMDATATVTHEAASLLIACGSGLARVAISTPCATQGQLALKENVEGPVSVIRTEHRRQYAILLPHGKGIKVLF